MMTKPLELMDNVLLASELIKGYNRAYNSPRCMVKVDIRKVYDSLKWSFLCVIIFTRMNRRCWLRIVREFIDNYFARF
jgi:hypothetical protein